jgi:hypothetical protein
MMRAGLASLVLLLAFASAPVQAQGASSCEKLTNAHAYNRCIAAAGPASRAGSGAAPRSRARAAEARGSSHRAVRSQSAVRGGVTVRRLQSGRMRMEIPAPRRR